MTLAFNAKALPSGNELRKLLDQWATLAKAAMKQAIVEDM